jgi:hypothetical protein
MGEVRRTQVTLATLLATLIGSLALFTSTAAATFEATMAAQGAARADGPTFIVEAGGGRRTRIRNFEYGAGKCGSIFAPLLNAGHKTPGFADGNGLAIFSLNAQNLHLRFELRVSPRGEALRGHGLLQATIGSCHERVAMGLVSTTIRGGGRHT